MNSRALLYTSSRSIAHRGCRSQGRRAQRAFGLGTVVHNGCRAQGRSCTEAVRSRGRRARGHAGDLFDLGAPFTFLLRGVTGGSSLSGETKNDRQGLIGAVETNKLAQGKLARPRRTHGRAQKRAAGSHRADHFEAEKWSSNQGSLLLAFFHAYYYHYYY